MIPTWNQMDLWGSRPYPDKDGIDLRCCDVAEILAECRGARLVHADPPWSDYVNRPGDANPDEHYDVLTWDDIDEHCTTARGCCGPDARAVMWSCWPLVAERIAKGLRVLPGRGWKWKTGGSWHKEGSCGGGYHWRGRSEPVWIGVKGSPQTDQSVILGNAHASLRTDHSEKPVEWLAEMLRRWTEPGDLVLDLYAGLAPMARACLQTGRRYLGAEIDPERHQMAMARLWRAGPCPSSPEPPPTKENP